MKRKIIGMLAIVIAIGASAFTSAKPLAKTTSYYWFSIADGIANGHTVPQADATFIQVSTTAPDEGCPGGSDQCVSGFTSSQVNASDMLKDNNQAPAEAGSSQN
jgi:hypothetical protein